ncbi:hypothetical protein LZ554_005917 [Drepanopeziza brunnea f. sp. 'monogermtubi']|nr:hypothetical protein LZ554_005917 [Drepanopeziza brunnea f. sp. 'monogermtubi']
MIWQLCAPKGRVVTIRDASTCAMGKRGIVWGYRARATYTVPAIFQVNRESRKAAKGIYDYTFTSRIGHPVPFNFLLDTLLFDGPDGASTLNSFINPRTIARFAAADAELSLMHARLRTLAVAGDDLYIYTSEDVAGFYNLRLCLLPWKTADHDDELRDWIQSIWACKLAEAKLELTDEFTAKEIKLLAAARVERARLRAAMAGMSELELMRALVKADTKIHNDIMKEKLELQLLRRSKTEVIFTSGLGVEAWLGAGVEVTKAPTPIVPPLDRRGLGFRSS